MKYEKLSPFSLPHVGMGILFALRRGRGEGNYFVMLLTQDWQLVDQEVANLPATHSSYAQIICILSMHGFLRTMSFTML